MGEREIKLAQNFVVILQDQDGPIFPSWPSKHFAKINHPDRMGRGSLIIEINWLHVEFMDHILLL